MLTFHYNGRMSNIRLSTEQWTRILDFLRGRTGLYVGQEADCRRFVEAVLWINRSGAGDCASRIRELEQRLQTIRPLEARAQHIVPGDKLVKLFCANLVEDYRSQHILEL